MTLKLFRVGRPSIVLYKEGALTTKKLAMAAVVLGAFPSKTDKVTTPLVVQYRS